MVINMVSQPAFTVISGLSTQLTQQLTQWMSSSKVHTQFGLNQLYRGNRMVFIVRYSTILMTVFICFGLGAAMPILYPIGGFTFLSMFYSDYVSLSLSMSGREALPIATAQRTTHYTTHYSPANPLIPALHVSLSALRSHLTTLHSPLSALRSHLTTRHSPLATRHSTLNTLHSTLATQHSTLATQHSRLATRHSTLATRHSYTAYLQYCLLRVYRKPEKRFLETAILCSRAMLFAVSQGATEERPPSHDRTNPPPHHPATPPPHHPTTITPPQYPRPTRPRFTYVFPLLCSSHPSRTPTAERLRDGASRTRAR